MIKLNNKNITYVALADSNNSIKAPKEIWYADSNNSVKLVYRRKNGLIEGVHIRRYGWLKGSNNNGYENASAILGLPCNSDSFDFTAKLISGQNVVILNPLGSAYSYHLFKQNIVCWSPSAGRNVAEVNTSYPCRLMSDSQIFTINGTVCNKFGFPPSEIRLQRGNTGITYTASLSRIKIDDSIRYTPVKLLRAIPAELDANGIARAAGTCGMYNEKKHKFYGITSQYGSFTVEGMAEGYDYDVYTYLKGTGGCYIDTLINPAWNDTLSATFEVSGKPTVDYPTALQAYGNDGTSWIVFALGSQWHKSDKPAVLVIHAIANQSNDYYLYDSFPTSTEIYIDLKVTNNAVPTVSCKINGASWTTGSTSGSHVITTLPDTTYKIGRSAMNGLDVLKLKNVKINSHNFIPCKLKRAIPAELDANGIARNAEECGMVDTYTGLFYGNVNPSGTFSVSDD